MLLALAVILMQAPAVPAPAIPAPYTNSSSVSVAAAPERKDDAKPETKADAKDGRKNRRKVRNRARRELSRVRYFPRARMCRISRGRRW
jgi:hypothetical protein